MSHMQHTRHISIQAPFHTRLLLRCPHHEDPRVADVAVMRRIDELLPDSDDVSLRPVKPYQVGQVLLCRPLGFIVSLESIQGLIVNRKMMTLAFYQVSN